MSITEVQPVTARCPHCHAKMRLVRRICLAEMPDLYVFYCEGCQHVETIKYELSAA